MRELKTPSFLTSLNIHNMKQFSFLSKTLGKIFVFPALLIMVLAISSCQKEKKLSIAKNNSEVSAKSKQMRQTIQKVLRGFVTAQAGGSSQQSFAGSGSNIYSNVTFGKTTYSNPGRTVYSWSDPSTPTTSYTFSESSSSSGGLGQLSYNGKSFDYNYVLGIKVTSADPDWGSIAGSAELRAIVAIDGQLDGADFTINNLAIFLVVGTSGEGLFEFGFFDNGASGTIAIGELLDFSDVTTPTLASMGDAKVYYASDGHVNVSETSFEMASNAKVKDLATSVEYSIDGALMIE